MLIKTYEGIEIHVGTDGKFFCTVGTGVQERTIKKPTLKAMERAIMALNDSVTLVRLHSTYHTSGKSMDDVQVIGIEDGKARLKEGGYVDWMYDVYDVTPEQRDELISMINDQRVFDQKWNELIDRLVKIKTPVDLRDVRERRSK